MRKIFHALDFNLVSHDTNLDKASSFSFLFGFITSKLQFIPNSLFLSMTTAGSLVLYAAGYLFWLIGSYYHPDHHRQEHEWYGFAQFREQHRIAAIVGLIAAVLSIAAWYMPVLTVPAVWMYSISNVIWVISEYHKLNNPPHYEENYSHEQQADYLAYSISIATISLIVSVATTMAFFLPLLSTSILLSSSLISGGIGMLSLEYWLSYSYGDHLPTTIIANSYQQMPADFYPSLTRQLTPPLEIHHHKNTLFQPPSPPRDLDESPIIFTSDEDLDQLNNRV